MDHGRRESHTAGVAPVCRQVRSNTSGVFKGFHRGWGGRTGTALYRILGDLRLAPPVFWDNGQDNEAMRTGRPGVRGDAAGRGGAWTSRI